MLGEGGPNMWRFGLSDDLIHWDSWADVDPGVIAPRLGGPDRAEFCAKNATVGNGLSSAVFAGGRQCYTDCAYPALLDPGCPTDSYDELGETAYLHVLGDAGWHTANLTTTRDIVRIKLQFSK